MTDDRKQTTCLSERLLISSDVSNNQLLFDRLRFVSASEWNSSTFWGIRKEQLENQQNKKESGLSQTFYRFSFQSVKKKLKFPGGCRDNRWNSRTSRSQLRYRVRLKGSQRSESKEKVQRTKTSVRVCIVVTFRPQAAFVHRTENPLSRSGKIQFSSFLNVSNSFDPTRVNLCADGRLSNERRRESSVHSSNKAEETWRSGPLTLLMAPVFGCCRITVCFSPDMKCGSGRVGPFALFLNLVQSRSQCSQEKSL